MGILAAASLLSLLTLPVSSPLSAFGPPHPERIRSNAGAPSRMGNNLNPRGMRPPGECGLQGKWSGAGRRDGAGRDVGQLICDDGLKVGWRARAGRAGRSRSKGCGNRHKLKAHAWCWPCFGVLGRDPALASLGRGLTPVKLRSGDSPPLGGAKKPAACRGQLAKVTSGADRDRTGDPLLAKQVLSQLSYRPDSAAKITNSYDLQKVERFALRLC